MRESRERSAHRKSIACEQIIRSYSHCFPCLVLPLSLPPWVSSHFLLHVVPSSGFQVGDVITVLNQEDAGWWEGELNGVKGLFPSNYVETVPDTMVSPTALPVGGRAGPPPINNNANGGRAGGGPPPQPFGGAATTTKAGPPPIKAGAGGPPKIPVVMPAQEQKTNGGGGGGGGGRGGGGGGGDVVKAAPAASSGAPRAEKLREARTKFGPWSSNMAFYSGINMIVFGCLGFIWYSANEAEDIVSRSMTLYCSLYSFFVGIGVLVWEHFLGQKRGSSGIPARGLVYTLLSLFLFMSWPTLLPAFFLFSTAFTNFVATAMGEVYDAPPKKAAPPEKKGAEAQAEGIFGAIKVYIASISQQNKVGQTIFFAAYVVGNVALFAYKVNLWVGKVHDAKIALDDDKTKVPTGWTPVAKGFGGLLDLNCALILMPVLRTIIRYLYNRSTADQGFVSTMLRGILYFIPLDQNLKFHKLIASVIMGATIGHTIAHYVNFSLRPVAVLTSFHGAWPLVSGGLVCLAMFYIYSAVFQNTKQGQFEIFWYSHHIFVFFFLILFVHGTNGLNPGFWQFFIGPGALYLVERLLRVYRANQRVVVLSATIMDDVFSLEFAKEGALSQYKEGQVSSRFLHEGASRRRPSTRTGVLILSFCLPSVVHLPELSSDLSGPVASVHDLLRPGGEDRHGAHPRVGRGQLDARALRVHQRDGTAREAVLRARPTGTAGKAAREGARAGWEADVVYRRAALGADPARQRVLDGDGRRRRDRRDASLGHAQVSRLPSMEILHRTGQANSQTDRGSCAQVSSVRPLCSLSADLSCCWCFLPLLSSASRTTRTSCGCALTATSTRSAG
jgi:hypothetical protein